MRTRIVKFFLCLVAVIMPLSANAACEEIVNRIHADIAHYTTLIGSQNLPWMKISWLKKNLGKGQQIPLTNNHVKYVWQCNKNSFISVRVNPQGKLTKVSGQYNSDQGSGLFYTFLQPADSSL